MDDLRRYFFCFKFYNTGEPFIEMPVSVALVSDRGEEYHALLAEGLRNVPEPAASALQGQARVRSAWEVKNDLLGFIAPAEEVQIWSLHDTHCRHFFAELFGGMDQNNAYYEFLDKGITKMLPRDLNHIYYGLGKPALPAKPLGHEWNALKTARWERDVFEALRERAQTHDVRVIPTTERPPDVQRLFFDWEYYRVSPFVLLPLSVGVISEDGQKRLHLAIEENIRRVPEETFNGQWLHAAVLPKLKEAERATPEEITRRILAMIEAKDIIEFWSDDDNHDRHLLGSLGVGEESFYSLAKNTRGTEAILFRDTKHLRLAMGWPNLPVREKHLAHNALYDAEYCLSVFNAINAMARARGISPETILPADFKPPASEPQAEPSLSLLHP